MPRFEMWEAAYKAADVSKELVELLKEGGPQTYSDAIRSRLMELELYTRQLAELHAKAKQDALDGLKPWMG